jgi:flagellar protein FliS
VGSMEKEQIKDFTRRLSQCNRGGLIVIMYDIYFAYADEAQKAYEQKKS